jgi:hypothetical protein
MGTPAASGNRRTTPDPASHQWTRILLRARKMRYATFNASGSRVSESRRRENFTYGLRWRGLETWSRWKCEPTPQSKRGTGNPPPTAGAPVLDPTRRRRTACAALPLHAAPDAQCYPGC